MTRHLRVPYYPELERGRTWLIELFAHEDCVGFHKKGEVPILCPWASVPWDRLEANHVDRRPRLARLRELDS